MRVSSPYLYSDGTVKIGALSRIGALINKNTPKGGGTYSKRGAYWKEGAKSSLNSIQTVDKYLP